MSQYCVEAGMLLLSGWDKDIPRLGKEGRFLEEKGRCARRCVTVQDYGPMDIQDCIETHPHLAQ